QQLRLALGMLGIGVDALDRADHDALRFVEMPDAFGAQRRVDHVDGFALGDRAVRAGRLADVAVDAELVDLQGHARIVSPAPGPARSKRGTPSRGPGDLFAIPARGRGPAAGPPLPA